MKKLAIILIFGFTLFSYVGLAVDLPDLKLDFADIYSNNCNDSLNNYTYVLQINAHNIGNLTTLQDLQIQGKRGADVIWNNSNIVHGSLSNIVSGGNSIINLRTSYQGNLSDPLFLIVVCLDPQNSINESNETNNCLTATYMGSVACSYNPYNPTATPTTTAQATTTYSTKFTTSPLIRYPDLIISEAKLVRDSDKYFLIFKIRNVGDNVASERNKSGVGDVILTTAVQDSKTIMLIYNFSEDLQPNQEKSYHVLIENISAEKISVCTDVLDFIKEANENNNCLIIDSVPTIISTSTTTTIVQATATTSIAITTTTDKPTTTTTQQTKEEAKTSKLVELLQQLIEFIKKIFRIQ